MRKIIFVAVIMIMMILSGSVYFNPYSGKVKILVDKNVLEREIKNQTVFDVLKNSGVNIGSLDIVVPGLNTAVTDGMLIKITRVKESIIQVREILECQTIKTFDPKLHRDEVFELETGENGFVEKEVKVMSHDGKEVWRKPINILNMKKPVNFKYVYGTSSKKRPYMAERKLKTVKVMSMRATGYYPGPEDCGTSADGVTSIGYKAGYGVVAIDPKVIAFKTKLYIEGYGFAIAADTGGAIKGNSIDLCFDTYKESSTYYPRHINVYILK